MQTKAKAPARATKAKAAPATQAPATEAPATEAAPVEIVYRTATRDAATVAAQRTNFGQYSDRDSAYLAFFGSVMRQHGDSATLAQIHAAGTDTGNGKRSNPRYTGSAKATDAGAINRLVKAGFVTVSDNGNKLHATERAKADSRYLGTK